MQSDEEKVHHNLLFLSFGILLYRLKGRDKVSEKEMIFSDFIIIKKLLHYPIIFWLIEILRRGYIMQCNILNINELNYQALRKSPKFIQKSEG